MSDLKVGDEVVAITGRYHGARGVVAAIEKVPTPSGSSATLVRFVRPRAGDTYAFPHELRRADEAPAPKPETPGGSFEP